MKTVLSIVAMLSFAAVSAQTDPAQQQPVKPPAPQKDSMSTNSQIEKESDLKTMDAVKTQDHPKIVRKQKSSKDSITKRNTRRK